MNDLGRSSKLDSEQRTKMRVVGAFIAVACVVDLLVSTVGRDHLSGRTAGTLYGVSVGLLVGAFVILVKIRRRP